MSSADHLVPKVVTDKNGVLTTRYVSDGDTKGKSPSDTSRIPTIPPKSSDVRRRFGTLSGLVMSTEIQERVHQSQTVDALIEELQNKDRASASLECGLGKTVIAQKLIKRHHDEGNTDNTGVYVFVAPSIKLVDQTRSRFNDNGQAGKHWAFTLHSESKDIDKARNTFPDDSTEDRDIRALAEFMSVESDEPKIIFATYDSLHKIAAMQQESSSRHRVEMVVFDESHRLSGSYKFKINKPKQSGDTDQADYESIDNQDTDSVVTHSGRVPRVFFDDIPGSLQAKNRVFLTATPSFYGRRDYPNEGAFPKGKKAEFSFNLNEEVLRKVAAIEDSGDESKASEIHTNQMNETLFGKRVISFDMRYAMANNLLERVDRAMSIVRAKIAYDPTSPRVDFNQLRLDASGRQVGDNEGMQAETYTNIVASINAFVEPGRRQRNALAFASTIKASKEYEANFKEVAKSLAGESGDDSMTIATARKIVDESTDADMIRRAKMVLLSKYANVMHVDSKNTQARRDAAFQYFDSKNQVCSCGGKDTGKWCACVRTVTNFDLFTEGIDIDVIDTIIQGNRNRMNDSASTQAIGRAARRVKGMPEDQSKGSIVVTPVLTYDTDGIRPDTIINATPVAKTLSSWSRAGRDATSAAYTRTDMAPEDDTPVQVIGGNSNSQYSTTDAYRVVSGNPLLSFILYQGYSDILEKARLELNKKKPTDAEIAKVAESYVSSNAATRFAKIVGKSHHSNWDPVLHQQSRDRNQELIRRLMDYDRDSLSETDRAILHYNNQVQMNLKSRVIVVGPWQSDYDSRKADIILNTNADSVYEPIMSLGLSEADLRELDIDPNPETNRALKFRQDAEDRQSSQWAQAS